jgi:hypothetical protein
MTHHERHQKMMFDIMNHFDYDKVRTVMKHLEWEWYGKGIPTGYIQGSVDGANKPATGLASYTNEIATKAYFSVDGANHYGITDVNNPFGANTESSTGTLSQVTAISKIAESSLIFLDAYIKCDTTALNKIINSTSGITNVTVTGQQ